VEEKQQRKAQRVAQERAAATAEGRRRVLRWASGVVLAVAAIGAVVVAVASGGGSSPATSGSTPPTSQVPFGPHYGSLDQRRLAVGVPTMMDTMNSPVHFHPVLSVWANGKPIQIPANLGIDPSKDSMRMAGLHTHDSAGTIHVEGVPNATLGQFFAVWGVAFSPSQLGPYRASPANPLRMWVNGKPSTEFGSLKLADGQRITVEYGPGRHGPA